MTPRQLFEREFSVDNLKVIFNERIAQTATTGKDGVAPAAFGASLEQEIVRTISKVRAKTYCFTTYKQRLVLKGAGKPPREISIATVRDRLVLRALTNILMECFSERRLPAPHHFVRELSELVRPLDDTYSFVQIDVRDFYPSIVHTHLMCRLRSKIRSAEILHVIESAIRTPTGSKEAINSVGVPQGLSISNILSAIYMTRFDELMHSKYAYFRYVDDIVIVCRSDKAKKTLSSVARKLKEIGLTCHELSNNGKTKISSISSGIDYLGYNLSPNSISVRKSSYKRMMDNIIAVLTAAKHTANHTKILMRLNIKITGCIFNEKRMGWMFFFSMTSDIKQLRRLDNFVSRAWRRAGLDKFGKPKRFVKSYYEIRYNLKETKYIPKFDEYSTDQKAKLIADMEVKNFDEVRSWSVERINRTFLRLVRKEVAELERDVTPIS
ncbi:RNA-directed DNA polymerase (reverse transcriptase) protein [Phyllobacterium salinisoli]|uniref:RNA-directed DNA polymerase (Reverse transcriptase) protein n=1 Tax=Phyllobacterium salinisoli TaxID=1899321 RepID=A0A368K563_9HYPH|nr:reverse transcriptase domain-containing protein [Phyllobacterium salinisoli]RCS23512.1 RNA-directed DNA polymerase (reverse transcriptase) protein [Phyllobacterium salinisoli]